MADEAPVTMQEYEDLAMAKMRCHHALWIVCGRDREKVRQALAQADAEHSYSPAAKKNDLRDELREAEDELAFAQRASAHYRIPERLIAAHRRVDAARAALAAPCSGTQKLMCSSDHDGVNPSDDFAQVKAQIMSMPESNLRQFAIAQAIQLGFHEKYGNAMSNANAAFVAEQKAAAGVPVHSSETLPPEDADGRKALP